MDNDAKKDFQCAKSRGLGQVSLYLIFFSFIIFRAWWHSDCTFVALNGEYGDKTSKLKGMHWLFQRSSIPGSIISYTIKPEKSLIKFRIKP